MNRIQRLGATIALTLALNLPAFAEGQIPTGPGAAPPSTRASISTEGVMDCSITSTSTVNESAGDFTETFLSVLEGVLALL